MPVSAALSMMVVIHLIMGFRKRQLGTIINSRKEIIDGTFLGVAAGVVTTVDLASVINDYVGTVGTVEVGSLIKSLYLFVQVLPSAGTANVDWNIGKKPLNVVIPTPGATGGDPARKYVLHEEKGIPGNAADGAYPLTFKGVIKIPRGRQRMAEGDKIQMKIVGADIYNACVKCIYKVYN